MLRIDIEAPVWGSYLKYRSSKIHLRTNLIYLLWMLFLLHFFVFDFWGRQIYWECFKQGMFGIDQKIIFQYDHFFVLSYPWNHSSSCCQALYCRYLMLISISFDYLHLSIISLDFFRFLRFPNFHYFIQIKIYRCSL